MDGAIEANGAGKGETPAADTLAAARDVAEAAPPPPLVAARDLGRAFGSAEALKGLTFSLRRGGRTALLGPNGAGKSTLMRLIAGVLPPDGGEILADGMSPARARETPGFLGWLPEKAPLNQELTVREHLVLAGKLRGLDPAGTRSEIERLSAALDMEGKLDRLAGRLSLGTRRQAALALALLGGPRLLLLDEPSSSLDPEEVRRLNWLVMALPETTTLLVSTHVLEEAYLLTDSALILKEGRLAAHGGWDELGAGLGAGSRPGDPGFPGEVFFLALGGAVRPEGPGGGEGPCRG
ncbi:MAG: ABC transporter ATP-binding protein [Deltaproteobacteria bacterium]|jgi:ABC-2 type transport system ATP-binding protein|nr:ABC transporter ATP-binding protein [Deltaproteobacteria bacterium]